MGFAYWRCYGPYGYIGMTSCSMGGQCPLTGLPLWWRVLWQLGPLEQGAEGPDVLTNFFHGSVFDSLGDRPFHYFKKKKNTSINSKNCCFTNQMSIFYINFPVFTLSTR